MNELTICLVTRGREDFLDASLASLEVINSKKLAKILIFNNGSPPRAASKLQIWAGSHEVEIINFDENDTRSERIFKVLRNKGVSWVLFPGDDDIVIPEAIEKFHEVVNDKKYLTAISFNLQEIDSKGSLQRIIRRPTFHSLSSKPNQVASAFHEPAFLWPSLFFDLNAVPTTLATSRFVFDWWVGIHLILNGEIELVDQVAVNYRQHPQQESNLAGLRRKFFEASIWLGNLIDSEEFESWLSACTQEEVLEFWNSLSNSLPIYGDEHFGYPIQLQIATKIMADPKFGKIIGAIGSELAASQHVFLKSGDVRNLAHQGSLSLDGTPSNVNLVLSEGACDAILRLLPLLSSKNSKNIVKCHCLHSRKGKSSFEIDCKLLAGLDLDQAADAILMSYSNFLENKGALEFLITERERLLINFIRGIRGKIPNFLKRYVVTGLSNRVR